MNAQDKKYDPPRQINEFAQMIISIRALRRKIEHRKDLLKQYSTNRSPNTIKLEQEIRDLESELKEMERKFNSNGSTKNHTLPS